MLINPVFTREVTIAPRREWTCVLRSVCVGLLLLFVVAAISSAPPLLAEVPALVISEETTRITGPLTADGQINFFKALEQWASPPELATDDNGFRVFVRLFGSDSVTRDDEFSDYAGFCGGFLFGTADVATSRFSNQSSA